MIGVGLSAGLSGSRRARTVQDPLPALDLDWATNRSLPASYGPTPSFSRASTGTYFDGMGVLKTAAVNGPRFDHVYNGTSWVSRGLLVEEQRTNLALRSEELNLQAPWYKDGSTVSSNSVQSPSGSITAEKIVENSANSGHLIYQPFSFNGQTYTFSCFAKAGERNWLSLSMNNAIYGSAFFDLSSGSLGTISGSSSPSASITNVGNGWYRCTLTATPPSGAATVAFWIASSNGTTSYAGDGSSGIYVWGAQLELGSFATSYIPTTSASSTRSADVCQITGGDFSSFWNASEGSVAVEFDHLFSASAGTFYPYVYEADGGSGSNRILLYGTTSTSKESFYVEGGGANSTLDHSPFPSAGTTTKVASAYKLNDLASSMNGGAALTDTSQAIPTASRLSLGYSAISGGVYLNGHIARLRYFNKRLPDATLQKLST